MQNAERYVQELRWVNTLENQTVGIHYFILHAFGREGTILADL